MKRDKDETIEPGKLERQLQKVMDEVGPDHYARATAADFATGGKYNAKPKKPPYALT